jgi:hypothetical protein
LWRGGARRGDFGGSVGKGKQTKFYFRPHDFFFEMEVGPMFGACGL